VATASSGNVDGGSGSPTLRTDLHWVRRLVRGSERWIARDPLTTEFYYFSEREKAFLNRMDGSRSLDELLRSDVAGGSQNPLWRRKLIERAVRYHLVLPGTLGHARRMRSSHDRQRRQSNKFSVFQLLAMKLPLFDPTRLLERFSPVGVWLFSKTALGILLIASFAMLAVLIGRWDEVASRLPKLQTLFTGDRVILMMMAYVMMKIIHELSHAMACRRWNAECHELGLYFLVFTPCLYCDVSDVWRLPSKAGRIMVSAAGIFAEMAVAVTAGWVWFFTYDGTLNYIAFNLMILGSVSTVLVNANPLLRYDGYYILSDLLDIPNLSEQSREAMLAPLSRWLSGGEQKGVPRDASWVFLFLFGLASFAYRMIVLVLILWGANQLLRQWGLELFAGVFTVLVIAGIVLSTLLRTRQGIQEIKMAGPLRMARFGLLIGVLAGCLIAVFHSPVEHSISAVGFAVPVNSEPLFVQRSGFLKQCAASGHSISAGSSVAVFESSELGLQVAKIDAEVDELVTQLKGLETRATDEPDVISRIAELTEVLVERRQMLETLRREREELVVVARTSGDFLEPYWDTDQKETVGKLTGWKGNPISNTNTGGWYEQGTLLGWICDRSQWRVEAFVGESDVLLIELGASARVQLDRSPFQILVGKVMRIDRQPLEDIPAALLGDPRLPGQVQTRTRSKMEETTYRVIIDLDEPRLNTAFQSLASVRIQSTPKTVSQRVWRYLQRTFRTETLY
jgi:putative peptide zinc metalloprotease protein